MSYYYVGPDHPKVNDDTCASTVAQEVAIREQRPCSFEDVLEDETLFEHGVVYPCGCVYMNTILSDGSIGWGGWWDTLCGVTHCLEE